MRYKVTTTRVRGDKCVSYWLPVNKNGGCAIWSAIRVRCNWDDRLARRQDKLKWMVVRNPFSRIYSCWRDKVERKSTFLSGFSSFVKPGDSFESFVDFTMQHEDGWDTDNHITSQTGNLRLCDFRPDIILRFETLAKDWKLLAERVGLESHLSHQNCTRSNILDHSAHVEGYTESLRRKVAERYSMDFERFGYDPKTL